MLRLIVGGLDKAIRGVRFPAVFGCAAACLLITGWKTLAPQQIADGGYRLLWLGPATDAVSEFRRAAAADPGFPYRWSDLAVALNEAGQTADARACFDRSVRLAPHDPQILLRAANFYFGEGKNKAIALELGRNILAETTAYDDMIFINYKRIAGGGTATLDGGIGSNPRAMASFFRFLLGNSDEASLTAAWQWMEERRMIDRPLAIAWTNWLILHQDAAAALKRWAKYVSPDPDVYRVSNWIEDPDFGGSMTGDGFAWRVESGAGAKVSVRDAALQIDFDAADNLNFHHVWQRLWLEPGRYRLSAMVRTRDLSTDEGIRMRIPEVNASTESLTGTHGWTQVSTEFAVAGAPRLARLQIVRLPSWKFDNKPHGAAWITNPQLAKLQ